MKTILTRISAVGAILAAATTVQGGTLVFDGVNDYVDFARPVSGDFTIECWFRSTQLSGGEAQWYQGVGLVDAEVNGAVYDFGLTLGNGKVLFGTGNPDTTIRSTSALNNGAWHHVAAVRHKGTGTLRLYVDGVLDATGAGATADLTAPPRMRLGSLATSLNFFQGELDEVRIWNVVRDAAQIGADMRQVLTGTEPGLVTYYRLDEGFGTMAHDSSTNGNV